MSAASCPVVLHLSGPLLEWLETHDQPVPGPAGPAGRGRKVELLCAGMYEPVLAALPRRDRVEQIGWLREAIARRFGVNAIGLWLTERVWEPELAADLVDAGVRYALVDDRHFLVTGFRRDDLHVPYVTESDGRQLALFPIDERLRYLRSVPPARGDRAVPPRAGGARKAARRAGRRWREVRRLARDPGVGVREGLAGPVPQHHGGA